SGDSLTPTKAHSHQASSEVVCRHVDGAEFPPGKHDVQIFFLESDTAASAASEPMTLPENQRESSPPTIENHAQYLQEVRECRTRRTSDAVPGGPLNAR